MKRVLWLVYGFLWLGGVVSGGVSKAAPWAAPLFLVLAGLLAILENRSAWRSMLLAALAGFVFELIGVHTGVPFGHYRYTDVLMPSIAEVPLAIAFAWLILIDYVRGVTANVFLGAMLMAAIDLLIDPLAAGPLGYWQWMDQGWYFGIPAVNFAGWFAASLVILALTPKQPVRRAYIGVSVIAFFACIAMRKGFYVPAAIGFTLLLLPFSTRLMPVRWLAHRPSETPSQSSPAS